MKFKQITATTDRVYALDENGVIWMYFKGDWTEIQPPEDKRTKKVHMDFDFSQKN